MKAAAGAIVYAITGLVIYLAATKGQLGLTLWSAGGLLVFCLVLSAVGIGVGARCPSVSALLMQAWAGAVLVVVSGGVAALTVAVVLVLVTQGPHPAPRTQEIATVVSAILAAIAGLLTSGAGNFTPAWLSKIVIKYRYGKDFEELPADQPRLDGYSAVRYDGFGAREGGPLNGWGYDSRRRRLKLIQDALRASDSGAKGRRAVGDWYMLLRTLAQRARRVPGHDR